jgi:tetratricopeptide (TPR) repeat protein
MPRTKWGDSAGGVGKRYYTNALRRLLLPALFAICVFAQSPIERAITLAREHNYFAARQLVDGVEEPSEVKQRIAFHRLKAAIASGLGEAMTAADEMRAALALAPGDTDLLIATAVAEMQAGRLEAALQQARKAGSTAGAQALIGDIQEKRGAYVAAAQAYQAAIALAPDREQYRIALSLELVQHHTFEPAVAVLQQAAPLFPKSAKIRTLLGIAQYAAGHTDEAITSLTDAIAVDPTLEPAQSYLTQIVLESASAPPQRTVDALCGGNAIVCAAVKSRVAHDQGDVSLQKEAIESLKGRPGDSPIARCELGRAYEWSSQWIEARVQMEACVRLNPTPQNHYRLGRIYGHLGLADLARQEMEIRSKVAQRMSEEVARRENAVQAFQYLLK